MRRDSLSWSRRWPRLLETVDHRGRTPGSRSPAKDQRATLERLIRRLGLAGRAMLLGHRSDVPALLAAADLFVLPSLSEGSPNALLEALQAGVPVVASMSRGSARSWTTDNRRCWCR